jgi:hypothetical protein
MNLTLTVLLIAVAALAACDSPEATRTRGEAGSRRWQPRQNCGNARRSRPFWETPQIIESKHAPIEAARQADELSRR